MSDTTISWKQFRARIDEPTQAPLFFRGQAQAKWGLVSTFHRFVSPPDPSAHATLLEVVHDYVSTWTGRTWNLKDNLDLASFLG